MVVSFKLDGKATGTHLHSQQNVQTKSDDIDEFKTTGTINAGGLGCKETIVKVTIVKMKGGR